MDVNRAMTFVLSVSVPEERVGRDMFLRQTTPAVLVASSLLLACGSTGDSEPVPSCAEVGAYLGDLCGSRPFGSDVRSDCQVFGLDPKIRRCLMGIRECSSGTVNYGCGLVDVLLTCTTAADCPTPLMCTPVNGHCGECATTADCASGMSCPPGGGACFPSFPDAGT